MGSAQRYACRAVDVFTKHTVKGNPLAVFTGATGIERATMQRIARKLY
jgi:predicted PhzF superfamily epimerase YddE/YHI9